MADKPMFEKLEDYQCVPTYQDRAAAAAAGMIAPPPYVATDPVKQWWMTEEEAKAVSGVQLFTFRDEVLITFPAAFFGKQTVIGTVTVGIPESMTLPLSKVSVLNLLPEGSTANVPGLGYSWPAPLETLTPVQRIERDQMKWVVHNLDVVPAVAMTPGEQVIADFCRRIATKLGA